MKKSYIIALVSALAFSTVSCSKDDDPKTNTTETTNLTATINGAQQVPATTSAATGTFTGVYTSNNGTKQLAYTVTYQGITPSVAHIHLGGPGVKGAVAIPFAQLTSPITGTVTLTNDQADKLLTNGMYVNIHSSTFPDGEIRGDIKKK